MDTVENLLEKLTNAVSYVYRSKLAPSVLLSRLPNGEYYGSIIKYDGNHTDKEVMHRARSSSIVTELNDLSGQVVAAGKLNKKANPVDELDNLIKNL